MVNIGLPLAWLGSGRLKTLIRKLMAVELTTNSQTWKLKFNRLQGKGRCALSGWRLTSRHQLTLKEERLKKSSFNIHSVLPMSNCES